MAPTSPPLLSVRSARKSFGPVEVLHGVDFEVAAGEVHVLAGENGAGKSTLVNILSGVHTEYDGEVLLQGEPRRFSGPADAAHSGIATIHQELSLVPAMTVADNLFLGGEHTDRWRQVDFTRQEREARRLLEKAGLDLSPRSLVAELPVSLQQMLEIVRALAREAVVLILDEPTSALDERGAEALFRRLATLRQEGVGIVYITHRMDEIYRLADRITVLRDGHHVGTSPAGQLPPTELVSRMVGRDLAAIDRVPPTPDDEVVVRVRDLHIRHRGLPTHELVGGVSFSLRQGEILGLAGLQGSGASHVLRALFGAADGRVSGSMELSGRPHFPASPGEAIREGVILLSSHRKAQGLAPDQSVTHSVSLASLSRYVASLGWIKRGVERRAVQDVTTRLRLAAASLEAPVRTLSGGNQQKAYLARCLLTQPRVLLLDEPTRGIDIGAKTDIYTLMRAWAAEGISILLITSELDELLLLSHRILVLHRGRIVAELDGNSATKDGIMGAAMGHAEAPGGAAP
ncbi:MAG: sugar ABC transporter ATP-binding protein [Gemmatimonadota bacterium]